MVKKKEERLGVTSLLDASIYGLVPPLPKLPNWKEAWSEPVKLGWLDAWVACVKYLGSEEREVITGI